MTTEIKLAKDFRLVVHGSNAEVLREVERVQKFLEAKEAKSSICFTEDSFTD